MNQATKQKIINEAEIELYPINEMMSDREWDAICAKRVGYITGAIKYAELLEHEKAKGEKLAEALEEIYRVIKNTTKFQDTVDVANEIVKALTEYKK